MIRCRCGRAIDRCAEKKWRKIIIIWKTSISSSRCAPWYACCRTYFVQNECHRATIDTLSGESNTLVYDERYQDKYAAHHFSRFFGGVFFSSLVRREEGRHAFLLCERWKKNRFIVGFGMCAQWISIRFTHSMATAIYDIDAELWSDMLQRLGNWVIARL